MNISADEILDRPYEDESVDKVVSDLFAGKLSLEQALQKLRTRLLDFVIPQSSP